VDTAPSAPASLTAAPASGSNVTLGWNAASDTQQSGGAGLSYNVRVGTTPGASNVVAPLALASGTRLVPKDRNAGERTSYTLTGLTPGATYYWSVQAIDSSFIGSGFATEGSFTMAAPVFTFSAAAYSVGEAGHNATITINRGSLTVGADSVHFASANGSATAGSDYTTVDQTVSFAAGETSKTVTVPIIDDSVVESSETVLLSLSSPSSGATLGSPSSATLTIVDNDRAFAFSSAGYSVNEGDGTAQITINRAGLTSGSDSVQFATANGTATAGSDYKAVSKTVSFAAGVTHATVSVAIINNAIHEPNETVRLSLSGPSAGAKLGTPSSATLTIRDDDNGKLVSARLTKKSFSSSQARKVKLTYRFAPKSTSFAYRLTVKKGSKWVKVRTVRKTGSFVGKHKLTVKKIFGSKPVKSGKYRLKLSANVNSKLLKFSVR